MRSLPIKINMQTERAIGSNGAIQYANETIVEELTTPL